MKLVLRLALLAVLAVLAVGVWRWFAPMPELQDGDLVFQTSRSAQSKAVLAASGSLYTHMGIVRHGKDGWVVIEAVGPVKETPLHGWIARGRLGRVAVYRPKSLSAAQTKAMFAAARGLYGRPYDPYFSFGKDAIYCSELAYDAYGAAGIELGEKQKIGDLAIGKGFARDLMLKRLKSDPQCLGLDADRCLALVNARELVTPVSIARDRDLKRVWSNYPF